MAVFESGDGAWWHKAVGLLFTYICISAVSCLVLASGGTSKGTNMAAVNDGKERRKKWNDSDMVEAMKALEEGKLSITNAASLACQGRC